MKSLHIRLVLTVCSVLTVGFVRGEFRIWTDVKGNSIEAEHVRTMSGKVLLRKQNGSRITIALDNLSLVDRRFAILQSPPSIGITVTDTTDRENVGYTGPRREGSQVRVESVTSEIKLKKTSPDEYDADLTLEVCLIGRTPLDRYAIIRRDNPEFRFSLETTNQYSYVCKPVDLRNVSGSISTGTEYEGYLVAVRDGRGIIIAKKATRPEFEKNAETLLTGVKGTVFDEDFDLVRKGRVAENEPRRPRSDMPDP